MKRTLCLICIFLLCSLPAAMTAHGAINTAVKKRMAVKAGQAGIILPTAAADRSTSHAQSPGFAQDPYLGAIVVDAAAGITLFEDNPDAQAPPASIVKLMDLLIILEQVKQRSITLQDAITIPAEAAKIGGSQVYLKQGEVFTVEELLYALMVQSANDAAVALAMHVAGTKQAFVDLMNTKARQLGMTDTTFHSVHGLPPGKGQKPDTSSPRDIAKLCRELLKWDVLRYTSVKERPFRGATTRPLIMRNHNHLLGSFNGCDGFKTGYYRVAGYSIAATAVSEKGRVIAVVFGSKSSRIRDAQAKNLLARGLAGLKRAAQRQPPAESPPARRAAAAPAGKRQNQDVIHISKQTLKLTGITIASLILLTALITFLRGRKKKDFLKDL